MRMPKRRTMRRTVHRLLVPCFLLAATSLSAPANAVPIPWKNCGKAGDLLSIQQDDASVWPPSVAAPVNATATLDAAGQVTNLRIFLVHGVAWTFNSGPLPASANAAGFVSLPPSFPVSVTSPPLPLAAGPYSTTQVFAGKDGGPSTTVVSKGVLAAQLDPPLLTNLGLSFNGEPGFPLNPAPGSASNVRVQMTESNGTQVFCLDLTVPLRSGSLVTVVSPFDIPVVSPACLAVMALLVAACGLFAARRAV